MPYLLSHGCDCLVASFPYLSGLSVYRRIAHGILMCFGSLLSLCGSRRCCLMFHRVRDSPNPSTVLFRTVTFIWNSFGRGSDHITITLYISFCSLRVSRLPSHLWQYRIHVVHIHTPSILSLVSTKPNGCGIINCAGGRLVHTRLGNIICLRRNCRGGLLVGY
jgi:hypothetical protein